MDAEEELWFAAQREADYDEDVDEQLLRDAPCANDGAPAWSNVWEVAEQQVVVTANATSAPETETEAVATGICAFPPLMRTSFMMRGDNGVVRWVTASGLDVGRATRKSGNEAVDSEIGERQEYEEEEGQQQLLLSTAQRRHRHRAGSSLGCVNVSTLLQRLYEEAAGCGSMVQQQQQQKHQQEPKVGGDGDTLWVTKYSPKRFRDLLSDDTINLKLLQWLKSWDAYTFRDTSAVDTAPERPDDRLAVLVGPPGVGKTTLAHVLAVHCGYEPLEINASVDRTTSRIENAIRLAVAPARTRRRIPVPLASSSPPPSATATTTSPFQSGVHHGKAASAGGESSTSLLDVLLRPRCLIIDEMDGIAANVAAFLLQQDVHCPVFCLCNDYYVPSLRQLRRQCQHVYHVPPIRPQKLLSRLSEIAERERLLVSQPALADLVQSSNGDVRCCLNTLQFIHRQVLPTGGPNEAMRLMREMQGKDTQLGLWDTWKILFERQDRTKYIHLLRKEYALDYEATVMSSGCSVVAPRRSLLDSRPCQEPAEEEEEEEGDCVAEGFRVDPGHMYVSRVVQQCADTSTLLDGLQEYFLQRSYADHSFQRTFTVADAFSFQDRLSTCAYRHASSAMLLPFVNQYAHATAVTCFGCCSSMSRSGAPLGFPREAANSGRQLEESLHITFTFRDGCHLETAAHLWSVDVISMEVTPMLLRCLCDTSLRVPTHSFASLAALNQQNQQLLRASIARHAMYGFTYVRSSSLLLSSSSSSSPHVAGADGNIDMVEEHWELSPPIHRIGCVSLDAVRSPKPANRAAALPASSIMVLQMKDEIKQLMVGEIKCFIIQSMVPHSSKGCKSSSSSNNNTATVAGTTTRESILTLTATTKTTAAARKRDRDDGVEVVDDDDDDVRRMANVGDVKKVMHAAAPPEKALLTSTSAKTGSASDASASTLEKPKPSGKRDFFGRPIPDGATASSKKACIGATRSGGAAKPATRRTTVQYTYHDGSTNAVRIPASFEDF